MPSAHLLNETSTPNEHSSITHSGISSTPGIYVYALGAIVLGVTGLVWSDFATNWQRVPANVPLRQTLAYLTAVCDLATGAALLWRRTARAAAATLAILYFVFVSLWVPPILRAPAIYDSWGNFFEESSLVIAALVLWASLAPPGSVWAARRTVISRLYGICAVSFALDQLVYLKGVATWVPKWIPPGQMFWAIATTVCFLLAAAAILSGILAGLAARLLTAMIVGFELLIWIPKLLAAPHDHFSWAGNAVSVAMAGAAWVVAGSLNHSPSKSN
jgi:uncharacterized membrane protein YphA (DoxX/SURF4 family)